MERIDCGARVDPSVNVIGVWGLPFKVQGLGFGVGV